LARSEREDQRCGVKRPVHCERNGEIGRDVQSRHDAQRHAKAGQQQEVPFVEQTTGAIDRGIQRAAVGRLDDERADGEIGFRVALCRAGRPTKDASPP
jgi:hypothetical protein